MNWKVMVRTMAFLLFQYPLLSTITNLLHAFSVHLMNCYFPDFWYSRVTEKRTSEGRNAIWEKSRTSCGNKVHYGNRIKEFNYEKRTGEVRLPSDQDEKINVIEKPIIKKGHWRKKTMPYFNFYHSVCSPKIHRVLQVLWSQSCLLYFCSSC